MSNSSIHHQPPRECENSSYGNAEKPKGGPPDEVIEYPPTMVTITVMGACMLAMFLVALDRTIISTAIPRITDQFNSIDDIGWYGSAYMLANCSVQLIYGRIYKFYPTKYVFLVSIALLEIGSAICGAAPNSLALILGRAIAGAGASGIFSGVIQIMMIMVPLHRRPSYTGAFGSLFGLASVLGPLLGGAFTQKVSWRWCFYINLPIGAITIIVVCLLLKVSRARQGNLPYTQQIQQLDPIGTVLFVGSMTSLILALQWAGFSYSWSSPRIIGLWVCFALTFISFLVVQWAKKDNATVPPRIFFQRSICSGFFYSFCLAASMMILIYYIPIWFQAVKGVNAVKSGIMTLPSILSLVIASIASGVVVQHVGYYVPVMITGPVISSIGAGLLTTFKPDTGSPHWIGYQFLYGFGLGQGMQATSLAAQAVLPRPDAPIGVALMFFGQQLGGAIFVAVGENVFAQKLIKGLQSVPGVNAEAVANAGATDLRNIISSSLLPQVLKVYNRALIQVWYVATAMTCLTIIPAFFMEWKDVRKSKKCPGGPAAEGKTDANEGDSSQSRNQSLASTITSEKHKVPSDQFTKTQVPNELP
ncbi:putative mfs multidrug [Phaeomoniella chlamydospora]|uniref:Putative mfs multidrug n=1 Tax=Phaeomoniella chlamydospora TaxID=158046 RepID=A0A0G2EZY1_PHACM|nr:putative mfs multidrug [Phaeomoniella chlamydospora]